MCPAPTAQGICPAPTAKGTRFLIGDHGGRRPCRGPAPTLAGLLRSRRSPVRAVSPFGLGLLSATAGKLVRGLRAWLASSRCRAAGLRLRPARCKVTLQRVFKYIGVQLFFAPSRPFGAVGRSSRSFVARFVAGAPPRSSSPAGAPVPSPSSPLASLGPRRGRRGYGRAVAGYARHFFSATAVPAAAWPWVSIGSDADTFSTA